MQEIDIRHRLLAILAADAAGYSRLMAADDVQALTALDAARRVFVTHVAAASGRTIDMAGDSVLAVFDTASGALSAAIAIQEELAAATSPEQVHMPFRIGIHLGDLLEKADGTVYGDGVNIAARLQSVAEPGGIMISHAVHGAASRRGDARFEDVGELSIKNVPQPVRAFRHVRAALAATSYVDPAADGTTRPLSVIVLPFLEPGAAPEQEYFADAITDDITTQLSRIRGSYVIGSPTALSYKHQAIDLASLARELGVRYVLHGRVDRSESSIEINARLAEAATGLVVWSDAIEVGMAGVSNIRRELVARLANSLGVHLFVAEGERSGRKNPAQVKATDLVMQARSIGGLTWSTGAYTKALELLERALQIDPDNAEALTWRGAFLVTQADSWPGPDIATQIQRAEADLVRSLTLDSFDHLTHEMISRVRNLQDRHDAALVSAETALELNPSAPRAHLWRGVLHMYEGHCAAAFAPMRRALELSPRDPHRWAWLLFLGMACLLSGDHAAAVRWLEKSLTVLPTYWASKLLLSAAYAQLGKIEEARSVFAGLDDAAKVHRIWARVPTNAQWLALLREHYLEGLVKCGATTSLEADTWIERKKSMAHKIRI
ncbi:tetratricopeptide repeat protein [Variovorax sp. J22R133]|uniref:adenylate/guanylate cyclase domain-containing protein n=1 Tax=Variovorax brevis TaxID=3053503 RepID=UPI002578F6B1|nr:tetratricopeptide repeat protein [Variovorax sp. J22R133]MDM0112018.1 tetratricopeptide repeat protein [Variovorax sp. J22R133]